jgi:uncharacterized protein YjbI with pentapeptide repeats
LPGPPGAGWQAGQDREEPHVPIDAEDLEALLPELDDAPGPELAGGGTSDGLRFAGLDLIGDATGARFLECVLADCGLDGVSFDRVRLATCRLADVRATAASFVDATWLDVVVTGGRFGALTAHGAELTRVLLQDVKVDYLDLRGATLVDVTVAGCRIGELDLTGADLRDLRFSGSEIGSLVLSGTRNKDVDLRGAEVTRLDGVEGLPGCTISREQLSGWAEGLAVQFGIRVG